MIYISDDVYALLGNEKGFLAEIASLPDAGITTASVKLLDRFLLSHKGIGMIFFTEENCPDANYLKNIIDNDTSESIIVSMYRSGNTDDIIYAIENLGEYISVIVIDDFYSCILHKNYKFIRNLMRTLKSYAVQKRVKIFFVNQYRYIIKTEEYDFAGDDKFKTLYSEHITPFLASVNNTIVTQKEVVYTAKESSADADVELNTVKPQVNVKVNGGKTYKFDLLENETSKFENGKLVVTSAATSNINITASEYDRSKWSISTALNADKKTLFGVGYNLGHSVTANVYVGNGIKPYYGITWNIGSHTKK